MSLQNGKEGTICSCKTGGPMPGLMTVVGASGSSVRRLQSTEKRVKKETPVTNKLREFGAAGEIRTLGPLLTATRFPVVLVMTTSILLHLYFLPPEKRRVLLYQLFRVRQEEKPKNRKKTEKIPTRRVQTAGWGGAHLRWAISWRLGPVETVRMGQPMCRSMKST